MAESNHLNHEVKAELIKKLKPYYEPGTGPLVVKFFNFLTEPIFGGYHVNIRTDSFTAKPASDYTGGSRVRRTVFALKKIKEFNHHYFNEDD